VTGIPAQRFGLTDRGVLNNGMKADIVVFDPKEIGETGDHMEPRKRPKGIRYALVNGTIVVENGVHTGKAPGSLIRKNESRR